jgi:DNA gyrase subunit B
MYVGPVDSETCVATMLQEAMSMALQSVLDRIATEIQIVNHTNGEISVRDNGPNLDPNEVRDGLPVVELLLTKFYACQDARNITRSNCNFGIVTTNALSKSFVFETTFGGSVWRQNFQCGVPLSPIAQIADCSVDFRNITFMPDDEIIQNTKLSYHHFQVWFNEYCDMIDESTIEFHDETTGESFNMIEIAR